MSLVVVGLVVALVIALRRAPSTTDVQPDDEEMAVPLRTGAGSVIDARGVPASQDVLARGGSLEEAEAAARDAPAPQPL